MIAVFTLIQEPAVRPNLGGPQHLPAGSQNDAHRFVVDHQRKARHGAPLRVICRYVVTQSPCQARLRTTYRPTTSYGFPPSRESSVRHVQRRPCRVDLTRRLDRGEARTLGTAAVLDLPSPIQRLERLGGEGNDPSARGLGR